MAVRVHRHHDGGVTEPVLPAEIPVQTPTKYETALNLKTAKALGLTVSPGLIVAVDEAIE